MRFRIIYKALALLGGEGERKAGERRTFAPVRREDIPFKLTIAIFLIGRERESFGRGQKHTELPPRSEASSCWSGGDIARLAVI